MSSLAAILRLIGARARRRPGRALFTILGLALATGFAGAIVAEATITGDRAATSVLEGLTPLARSVRVTYSGIVTPAVDSRARALLAGLGPQTEVVLLDPVRLGGTVVRTAAIAPLARWTTPSASTGACRAGRCQMLLAGGSVSRRHLDAPGIHIVVMGRTSLRSAAPLGFTPTKAVQEPPLLLGSDVPGLEALSGLGSVYRNHSWMAALPPGLHAWRLGSVEHRLYADQAALLASNSGFSLTAPFGALDAARAQARAAEQRLRLAGGGALAALALFIVLAAGGLRREVEAELGRLRNAGATARQCTLFAALEALLLCLAAVAAGAVAAVAAGAVEAAGAGVPVGAALTHSLITPAALLVLGGGWIAASALIVALLLLPTARIADVVAVAAVAALALALLRGSGGGSDPLPVLLAPLACLAAGVLVYRVAAAVLRGAERIARGGPLVGRLALVGLARAPAGPSLAIAFTAVSVGLGAFALAYHATLMRSSSDQAAQRVPLDAVVSAGGDFVTPLELAPLRRWQTIAGGTVAPVRRTEASFVSGGSSVTVPALGVPGAVLTQLRGWRASDGSAPLAALADRMTPAGSLRTPGPHLPATARSLSIRVQAVGIGVNLTADLRDSSGDVRRLALGQATTQPSTLRVKLPRGGPWELEALELGEPTGLAITGGHQNAENPAAATRLTGHARLGSLTVQGRTISLARWRAVGAASGARARGTELNVRFSSRGELGLLRPTQPSDLHPLPVLADPQTAAAAGRGRRLGLTIDGFPIQARVVGVLARFPTIGTGTPGFIVADQQALAGALDAQDPGQGRPDELWIASSRLGPLRAALRTAPLAQLSAAFRADIRQQLLGEPIAGALLGTLIAAAAICGVLAVIGLIVALLGSAHDQRVEGDLIAQGVGPRTLRAELTVRLAAAGLIGVVVGLAIGVSLTRLAVATVRAAATVAAPQPPVVAVAPWAQLVTWSLAAAIALVGVAALTARRTVGRAS